MIRLGWLSLLALVAGPAAAHEVTCDWKASDLCHRWSARFVSGPVDSGQPDRQGTVSVELEIDRTGHVSACRVQRSSGNPELDSDTCQQLQAYAHYRPALDDAGHLTTGYDELTIEWVFHPPDSEAGGDQPGVTVP